MLDTNIWLDLLLFADPRVAPLAHALRARQIIAIANEDTRAEWVRVLGYPALRLGADRCETMIEAFDALVEMVIAPPGTDPATGNATSLPRCTDPDDQIFLELARDSGARWLLSRDSDLLMLAGRCRRDGWFSILTAQAWAQEFTPPPKP